MGKPHDEHKTDNFTEEQWAFHRWTLRVEEQLYIMKWMVGMMRAANAVPHITDDGYTERFELAATKLLKELGVRIT